MRDHPLDRGEIRVSGGLGRGQDQRVVEDVEALVLHGPHVEVRHGDDVEHVEIVLPAKALLVPAHAALEGIHRPGAALLLAGLHVDAQIHLAPRGGREVGGVGGKIAADERKQVAGLGVGVAPYGIVPLSPVERAAFLGVAVGKQHRSLVAVGLDADGIGGEHVRPIQEVGDAPKPLGLALRAVDAAREIEPGQRLVGVRIAIADDLELEGGLRRLGDDEFVLARCVLARRERAPKPTEADPPGRDAVTPTPELGRLPARASV